MLERTQKRYICLLASLFVLAVHVTYSAGPFGGTLQLPLSTREISSKTTVTSLHDVTDPAARSHPSQPENIQQPSTPDRVARPPTFSTTIHHTTNFTRQASIVVQLSGEMANNLHHIAHGIGLQLWAKEEFDIDCNLILRHHEGPNNRSPRPKWKSARDNIQQCFPQLANWNFGEGNKKDFLTKQNLQRQWLLQQQQQQQQGENAYGGMDDLFGSINSRDPIDIQKGLAILAHRILPDPHRPSVEDYQESAIRLPFLLSETLDAFPMIDKYYTQIRNLMEFNETACCATIPSENDSVFHFRNYQSEMPERRAYEMGFAELSPNKTAMELFGHLQPGIDNVKLTTRVPNQIAKNYVDALEGRGIPATLVSGQSAVEDFCFLRAAQKELAGSARSTFVLWAALLGNVSKARLYHVDNIGLRQRHADYWDRFTYKFTHPMLRDRIKFELYRSEEIKVNQL